MKILIAESGQHVVAACRLMAKEGHEIVFLSSKSFDHFVPLFLSKSYSEIININKAENDFDKIKQIKEIYDQKNCDMFFPFGYDLVTAYINESHDCEELWMNTPYAGYEQYWKLSNKFNLYTLLKDTDICLPKLYGRINNESSISLGKESFPVIVKKTKGVGIIKNVILASSNQDIKRYVSAYVENGANNAEFIVQQYIAGDIFDVGGFAIDGEIFCAIPQRRTITYPINGGVAAVNDIYADEKLIQLTKIIISKAKWTGPFQAEFRHDPESDTYVLLEVNTKMWGSSPLSFKANDDLLRLILQYADGKKVKKNMSYRKNICYRWITNQEIKAMVFASIPEKIGFLKRFFGNYYYDIDFDDIGPDLFRFLKSLIQIFLLSHNIPRPLIEEKKKTSE